MDPISNLIACRTCQGDPRASAACQTCHGAQVELPSPDGHLVWTAPIDDFAFAFRRLRIKINAFIHVGLAALVVFCLAAFFYGVVMSQSYAQIYTVDFWQARHWFASFLWLGGLLGCFLVFRLSAYGSQVKALPNWGMTKRDQAKMEAQAERAKRVLEISDYFLPAALSLLEDGYELAKRVGRTEVAPVHLFSAALTSPAGGIFMTRLGMDFEKIKEGLVALIRRGQAGSPTRISLEAKKVLLQAYLDARQVGRRSVGTMEIFLEAFLADAQVQEVLDAAGYPPKHVQHVAEWIRIQEQLREEHDRFVTLSALKPKNVMNRTMTARQTPLLDQFSEDLTLYARGGYIGPVIGRERELNEIMRAFESGRKSVVLIGENGVGKTALVEAVARRMVEEDVPDELFDKRLVSIKLSELVSSGEPGMASQRLIEILHEVVQSGNIVLVLEGIEALSGGGIGGPMDLAEAFAAELDRGYFRVIATTTPQAWTTYLERRSLGGKLSRVNVAEMDPSDAIRVLMAKSGTIEYQNNVFFSFAALEKLVALAGRYMHDKRLPESAIDIAKEAAVLARREHGDQSFVTAEDVAKIIQEKTNIPVEAVGKDETEKLLNLEAHLHGRVIGQEDAVKAVAQAMRRARADIREGKRPIANFLFLGPTGVGKTELSKALAAEYFGSEQSMVRVDMSEYQDAASVARMIGASGDDRGGLLTEAVRKNPFAIVLLDEIEKAHPDILTLFLQVMDDGRLTDGVGRTVDFTNVVLIATSNAATPFVQEEIKKGTPMEQVKTALLERELKGIFRPEFLNRFDGIIVFKPLALDDVTQIAWLMIGSIAKRMEEKGMNFRAEDRAVEGLAQAGFDPLFGARPLRRVIQERVENALADLLLRKGVGRRDTVILQADGSLRVEKSALTI